jgi:hypothetical protein
MSSLRYALRRWYIDSDPITGRVSNGIKASRPFQGWIELAEVIEAARQPEGLGDDGSETLGSFPGAKGEGL